MASSRQKLFGRRATRRSPRALSVALVLAVVLPAFQPPAFASGPSPLDSVLSIQASVDAAKANLTVNASAALGHLDEALATFRASLAPAAAASGDLLAEWRIAWEGARDAALAGNATRFAHYRQLMFKLDLAIAWVESWHHLNVTRDIPSASAWFEAVAWKFAWSPANNDASAAMENITISPASLDTRKFVVFNVTIDQFVAKTLEEVSEVASNLPADPPTALEKAAEGLGYFYGVRFAIAERSGDAKAAAAEGAVRASVAAAWRADKEGAEAAKDAVDLALAEFRGLTDVRGILAQARNLAELVAEEYALGVAGGAIIDAVEYNESLDFFEDLVAKWSQAEPQVRASPGGGHLADEVDLLLLALGSNLTLKAEPAAVDLLVRDLAIELDEAADLVAHSPPPSGLAPSQSTGPWLLLGLMIGLILGAALGTLAFAAYVRRLRGAGRRQAASDAVNAEGERA